MVGAQIAEPAVTAPPPAIVPIEKKLSLAEITLRDYPTDKSASTLPLKIQREISLLALKEPLWVYDFQKIRDLADGCKETGWDGMFLVFFGKPDSERSRTERRVYLGSIVKYCAVREYIYDQRVLNPITDKKEQLTLRFVDGYFSAAEAESGNEVSR